MPLNDKISDIKVECYSGYKADERPVNFISEGKKYIVDKIVEQWRSPDSDYFKVQADDGKSYLLRHNNIEDIWALEKIF